MSPRAGAMDAVMARFVAEGLRRSRAIDCFDFVPSNSAVLHGVLGTFAPARFCEWGSGIGIGLGIAAMLGFDACGIELHPELADASRQLLQEFGLEASVVTGDYLQIDQPADLYFAYCWPGKMQQLEQRFLTLAPPAARLLICHGAEDIRCKIRPGLAPACAPGWRTLRGS